MDNIRIISGEGILKNISKSFCGDEFVSISMQICTTVEAFIQCRETPSAKILQKSFFGRQMARHWLNGQVLADPAGQKESLS
jgi:hypothetical protein